MAIPIVSDEKSLGSSPNSDAALLQAATRHDQKAFHILVNRYYRDVYRVVYRLSGGHADTEDITQEAFLRLWTNPSQLRDAGALKGWLIRVGANMVMDRFRRKPTEAIEAAEDIVDGQPAAEAQLEQKEMFDALNKLVAELPDRQRLALTLVHFELMTNIVAAKMMEVSVDALESLLARARRSLREKLGPAGRQMLKSMEERS